VSPTGLTRLIAENPFGNDYKSAQVLGDGLKDIFYEENIYRFVPVLAARDALI
jgi:glucose-6-phosphate 1-dehydrogenase